MKKTSGPDFSEHFLIFKDLGLNSTLIVFIIVCYSNILIYIFVIF